MQQAYISFVGGNEQSLKEVVVEKAELPRHYLRIVSSFSDVQGEPLPLVLETCPLVTEQLITQPGVGNADAVRAAASVTHTPDH